MPTQSNKTGDNPCKIRQNRTFEKIKIKNMEKLHFFKEHYSIFKTVRATTRYTHIKKEESLWRKL